MTTLKKLIHPHTPLLDFIKTYPNQQLQQGLKLLQQSFPVHIPIKGDGNCFYRAFAFLYLSSNSSNDFNKVFPKTVWICRNSNKIQSNQQFQDQLFQMWDQYVKNVSQMKSRIEKQKKILAIFNSIPIFDELMVGYFRSCTYHHMIQNKQKLSPFSQNQSQFANILERISTLGNESEGAQISSLADAMKTKIMIFCINQNGFYPIESGQNYEDKGFYLFFRPGHYDIVCPSWETPQNQDQIQEKPMGSWLKLTKQINSLKATDTRGRQNQPAPYQDAKSQKVQQNILPDQKGSPQMRSTYNFSTKKETTTQSKFDRRFCQNNATIFSSSAAVKKPYKFEVPSWDAFYEKAKIQGLSLLVIFLTGYLLYCFAE